MNSIETFAEKAKTGIWGLDNILAGGFSRGHVFLLEGAPGTGKTTIALQFLMEGAQGRREVPLHHAVGDRTRIARRRRLAWLDAGRSASKFSNCCRPKACSIPSSSRACCIPRISNSAKPPSRFSRRSNARGRAAWCSTASPRSGCWRKVRCATAGRSWRSSTISQSSAPRCCCSTISPPKLADKTVHSVAHGVIRLEELAPAYGAERRRARIVKYRGVKFRGGYHDFTITTGGLNVFPRLVASEHRSSFVRDDAVQRHRRIRPAAGRRRRDRVEHADPRAGRHRQIADRDHFHRRRDRARREGGAVRVRRRAGPACSTA